MKIFIGADHAGNILKEKIRHYLQSEGYNDMEDVSPENPEGGDDYSDYAIKLAEKVAVNDGSRGILVCDTGTGMAIAANKVRGAYAALVTDAYMAKKAREHNDANIIVFGSVIIDKKKAIDACLYFLDLEFSGADRHIRRINKIKSYERYGKHIV